MDDNCEASRLMRDGDTNLEGLEDICLDIGHEEDGGNEYRGDDVDNEHDEEEMFDEGAEYYDSNNLIGIDSLQDIAKINFTSMSPCEVMNCDFGSLEMAYTFYNWYARFNGFAVRKSKILRNNKGDIVQRTFVCYRQGYRKDRGLRVENRKREPKPESRCGCEAKFRVHIDIHSQRWYVTYFIDEHSHDLLEEKYYGMLPAHRKMSDADIMQMNNMRKVGIGTPQIYCSFASQAGGYEKIGFCKKDIYNQIGKQRKLQSTDAMAALQYLHGLGENDLFMFYRHTVDEEGRLQHLFWCDGYSQLDYKVFGDVLAFDATYGKNKYQCPVVIFSGVNHHNQTIIFGCGVIANETEETYVWLLEMLMEAMKGKKPMSIITDGDLSMKNAIKRVFPSCHHRLCAWHLIRNANTNIGIPAFTAEFTKCMLSDYETCVFKQKWNEMVTKFGVQEHSWVAEMYGKRRMWATCYIRGNFFAGFRTTSRCEGFHSQIKKFVHARYNLVDFLEHFMRCLTYMRHNEKEADFNSAHGDPVLQTNLVSLERSAAKVYTRKVFNLFRGMLGRASLIKVIRFKQTSTSFIFTVCKYQKPGREWNVSFHPRTIEFKCCCKRMESIGLPCDHIVGVLVYLDIEELPKSLVLRRWSKDAKEGIDGIDGSGPNFWDNAMRARYLSLMDRYRVLSRLACKTVEDFNNASEKATNDIHSLQAKNADEINVEIPVIETLFGSLKDPAQVRSKGRPSTSCSGLKSKRSIRCSVCKVVGHNKKSCPVNVHATHSKSGLHLSCEDGDVNLLNDD